MHIDEELKTIAEKIIEQGKVNKQRCPLCGDAEWVILNKLRFLEFSSFDGDADYFKMALTVECNACGYFYFVNPEKHGLKLEQDIEKKEDRPD